MAKVILGTETSYVRDLDETLDAAKDNKQDFVVIPLFHPRNRRDGQSGSHREGPGTRSDMVLESTEWISNVVGKITEVRHAALACSSARPLKECNCTCIDHRPGQSLSQDTA